MRIKPGGHEEQRRLTPEELRSIVLESTPFFPQKHRSILLNLFDLDAIQVDDVMTPRAKVESLDLLQPLEALREQLATCHHNKLPVYEGELNRVKGMLHVRRVLALLEGDDEHFTHEALRDLLTEAYFIPQGTPVFEQLQHFQETKQRIGLVVDEYGEVQGLVTLEDIIEEIIGEFTTHMPGAPRQGLRWNQAGEVIVDGSVALRELNKALDLELPIDGPKTLNGLLLEWLREIPDSPVAMRQQGVIAEALQIEDRIIKTVRLRRDDK
jgi:Mg2+/Co2+ transporter CorB